jgi:hypothetical protein
MLHVFPTNRIKFMAQKSKTANKLGQREYAHALQWTQNYFSALKFDLGAKSSLIYLYQGPGPCSELI